MSKSRNSKVRNVRVMWDGTPLRAFRALSSIDYALTNSRAGLSELSVEQTAKRRFGESSDDFHERILDQRSYLRGVTESRESRNL